MKVKVILWKYYAKGGKHPVRLRLQHGQETRYYGVKDGGQAVYLSEADFKAAQGRRTRLGAFLQGVEDKARRMAPDPFRFEAFEAGWLLSSPRDFYAYWEDHIAPLKDERPGTYMAYKNALSKWRAFRDYVDPVEVIGLLPAFEKTIPRPSTRGFYLRATRAVYNALRARLKHLPEWRYTIRSKVATHKGTALSLTELKAFLKATGTPAQMAAKRLWLISFYAGGMNVTDILHLRHDHLKDDRLVYRRTKTKRTKDELIEVVCTPELSAVIGSGIGYVIQDFNRGTASGLIARQRGNYFIGRINARLKALCTDNGLPVVTTYSARHTFASLLKAKGVGIDMIRELLGHSDARTTEAYLQRFDFDSRRKAVTKVLKLQG